MFSKMLEESRNNISNQVCRILKFRRPTARKYWILRPSSNFRFGIDRLNFVCLTSNTIQQSHNIILFWIKLKSKDGNDKICVHRKILRYSFGQFSCFGTHKESKYCSDILSVTSFRNISALIIDLLKNLKILFVD